MTFSRRGLGRWSLVMALGCGAAAAQAEVIQPGADERPDAAAAAVAESSDEGPTGLLSLFPPDAPAIELSSFTQRAQRCFEEADISIAALIGHPDRSDEAVTDLLRQYRRQLMRGRMELARARALRQPVRPVVTRLERLTAEHLVTLRTLLPRLSPGAQRSVRHTVYVIDQVHRSAQASLAAQTRRTAAGTSVRSAGRARQAAVAVRTVTLDELPAGAMTTPLGAIEGRTGR